MDEQYPFFINKFNTKKHPLFPVTGSSYPSGIPNNTDITETYASVKAEREKAYKQKMAEAQERDQRWEIEDQQRAEEKEKAEQADLSAEFNAAADNGKNSITDQTADYSFSEGNSDNELQAEMEAAIADAEDLQHEIQDISEDEFESSLLDEDAIDEDF